MENFEESKPEETGPIQSQVNEIEALIITEDIRSYIYETARWTKFLAILGFILSAFVAIAAFGTGALINTMNATLGEANNPYAAMGSGVMTVFLLIGALIYFYPSLLLFKYATAAKQAVLFGDQLSLSAAMSKMKSFFKFWGIFTIVVLSFYVLMILFVVVAGIGAASL